MGGKRQPDDEMVEQDVPRLIGSALSVPARPLSDRHRRELAAAVALRAQPSFPGWALFACCGCILALALFGVAASEAPGGLRMPALLVPAANLFLGPLAAWVIVRRKHSSLPTRRSRA
ncbi:MAG: hypothetical protein ACOYEW_07960 [Anaerolineae bacterium]|jgi:hypothetical protein